MMMSETPCMERRCEYHAAYADQMKREIAAVNADLAAALARAEKAEAEVRRWKYFADHTHRFIQTGTGAWLLWTPTRNVRFDSREEAIDAAIAREEKS